MWRCCAGLGDSESVAGSLQSKTVLTDIFLGKKKTLEAAAAPLEKKNMDIAAAAPSDNKKKPKAASQSKNKKKSDANPSKKKKGKA